MPKFRFAFALLVLVVTALPYGAQAQWQEYTSADGDFSFSMSAKPQEERKAGTHYNLPSESLLYVSRARNIGFVFAGRTRYHADARIVSKDELQANADNFSKAINGKLISQRFFTWSGSGGASYEAHESTIDSERGTFRQLYVIDGKTVYGVIAGPKNSDNEAEIDRFFSSLRVIKRR
jgi:hypothetical protein